MVNVTQKLDLSCHTIYCEITHFTNFFVTFFVLLTLLARGGGGGGSGAQMTI